jgi:hypothetical protein
MEPRDMMCPHCGDRYCLSELKYGKVPEHAYKIGLACPGSHQHPRSIYDKRPLWRDEPENYAI